MIKILSLGIILIFLAACSQQITGEKMNSSKSSEYAKKIENLQENKLPNEWHEINESVKLPERWDAIASNIYSDVMKTAPPGKFFFSNEEIVGQLLAQYKGTFKSTKNDSITVVSIEKNLFVTITAGEMQNVLEKKAEFDVEKLKILKKIFG